MFNGKKFQFGRRKKKMNLLKISRYYTLRDLRIRRSGLGPMYVTKSYRKEDCFEIHKFIFFQLLFYLLNLRDQMDPKTV